MSLAVSRCIASGVQDKAYKHSAPGDGLYSWRLLSISGRFLGSAYTPIWEQGCFGAQYMQTRFGSSKVTVIDHPLPSVNKCQANCNSGRVSEDLALNCNFRGSGMESTCTCIWRGSGMESTCTCIWRGSGMESTCTCIWRGSGLEYLA
jgi:hypothetical protein